jgi:hypothetical protein
MSSLESFGVPLGGEGGRGGLIEPMASHKFRVTFTHESRDLSGLSQQLTWIERPSIGGGMFMSWMPLSMQFREDVTGIVGKAFGGMENENEPVGIKIEMLDGAFENVLETWTISGTFTEIRRSPLSFESPVKSATLTASVTINKADRT